MEDDATMEPRAKRLKKDKFGRFAALQKLKQLKGSKHKYEIDDVDNVYETVDEVEYTKKVLRQQEEDWIVDDDGSGYIEDGRDIFDDDMDVQSIAQASKGKGTKRKKKTVSENAGKGNLQFMLSNMPNKKKEDVVLENDDVLSELISEIDNPEETKSITNSAKKIASIKPQPNKFSLIAEKKAAKNYMKSFVVNKSTNRVKIEEVEVKETVCDKENVAENSNETVEVKEEVAQPDIKPASSSSGSKLLFTIEEPKVKEEPITQEENETFTEADFEDDFDFDMDMDTTTEVKNESETVTEEQLSEGCFFSVNNADIETEQDCAPELLEEDDKEGFLFYWLDAFEDPRNQPGVVLLFGKTFSKEKKKYISCCVVVKNIMKKIYLLPRQYYLDEYNKPTEKPVTMVDVYNEFNNVIAPQFNLQSYKSRKVTKNYAFDAAVPAQSEYLEVRFQGEMDLESKNHKTISHIFGINSPFLEIFLLERKIKGPCWLKVFNSSESKNPFTYTTLEMTCLKPSDVVVFQSAKTLPPPPLVLLTLNVKIATSKSSTVQIALISGLVNNSYYINKNTPNPPFQDHFCVFSKLSDQALPFDIHVALSKYKATKVQKLDTERALLNYFLAQVFRIDPDLIVGFDMNDSILADRLQASNATNISRLSRIKRVNKSLNRFKLQRQMFAGRLVCDVKISAKELIKSRSYDLETLCTEVLKVPEDKRIEIEPESVGKMYERSVDLFKMISITMQDTAYILRIMYELQVIPLALQITNIAGNIMSRTLTGGRSERNEFLLLHAFTEKDYIVPEKRLREKASAEAPKSRNKKPTYSGGLVLEPKVGFYHHLILLMDFNSLYPSIIQEYNICFTTIEEKLDGEEAVLPEKSVPSGILPTEIRKLVESRREVKKLMANPDLSKEMYQQYYIRQMALKLTANSMYGCLGFSNSRFFGKSLAALVTHKGREILTNTRELVQRLNFEVIYGDTDSIMVNTNSVDYEHVMSIGKSIKVEVNKLYRQVELDIDGVFKYLLLLKKKKYAAVCLQKGKNGALKEITELKGLDIVRRDWSQLSAETGKYILEQILSEQTPDERVANIHAYLEKIKVEVEQNNIPLPLLVITKQLTKEPHMYPEKNSLPHVLVALRYNQNHKGKKFKAGDTVDYVICRDGTNNSATMRAYLLDELKTNENLTIDHTYYLAQQIHPVVSRICDPIDGTDAYQIANCLGLEGASFKQPAKVSTVDKPDLDFKKLEYKFNNVEPFSFNCVSCKSKMTMSLCVTTDTLDKCSNLKCDVRPVEYLGFIQNKLALQVRDFVKRYYKYELTCEDPACTQLTVRMPQKFHVRYPICTLCKKGVMYKVYTEKDLYTQILFFRHIFEFRNLQKKIDPNLEDAYNTLKEMVDNTLQHSAYGNICLNDLFKVRQNNKDYGLDSTQIQDEDANEDI